MRNGTKKLPGGGGGKGGGEGKEEGLGVDMMNIKRLTLCDMYYVFHRLLSTTHFRNLVH